MLQSQTVTANEHLEVHTAMCNFEFVASAGTRGRRWCNLCVVRRSSNLNPKEVIRARDQQIRWESNLNFCLISGCDYRTG